MAAPNPYFNTSEDFDPALHWGSFPDPSSRTYTGESVESHSPSGEGIYSKSSSEESLQGVIDSARLRGFLRYCLGYNNVNTVADYQLQRTNPICHPRMTGLICSGASHRPFSPNRRTPPTGSTNSGLKLQRNDDLTGVVCSTEAGPGSTPHTFPYYAGYEKELVTLRFTPPRYAYLPDTDGVAEYYRNTILDTDPRTEVLSLSGFQEIYAEGGTNTAPTSNPKGNVFPADVYQVLAKPDLKVTWFDVPEKFISQNLISAPGQVFPAKIVKALGTLNKGTDSSSNAWMGFPFGTLLFVGAHLQRSQWGLAAGGNGVDALPGNTRESLFNYDIELLFSYFKPTKGYDTNIQITDAKTEGHNCVPWRGATPGTVLASTDINQGRWFFATYSGLLSNIGQPTGDQGIYRYSNFDNIFSSVWMPDLT